MSAIEQRIEKIKEAIWRRRPILSDIIKKHGHKTLYDYSQDFLDVNKSALLDERKPELIAVAERLIGERLGDMVGREVAEQLRHLPLVSTADHHGPLTHPFFVNSNIIGALPLINHADCTLQYLVDFSFASVSLNNSSFPRGILFHPDQAGAPEMLRLAISPDKIKMGAIHAAPRFTIDNLVNAKTELVKKAPHKGISAERTGAIGHILTHHFGADDVLAAEDLNSQITKINFQLWPKFFISNGLNIPDVVYLEIETLVSELLITRHLLDPQSLLYTFILDPKSPQLILELFNTIQGAFSLEKNWGTYLFWAVDDSLHRIRLSLKDGRLHSPNSQQVFDFTPAVLIQALEEKKIFPSMMLCYAVVALYYGMKCLGGFSQVHDLTLTKKAWQKFWVALGQPAEAAAAEAVQTKEFGGDGMVLAYLPGNSGELVPATGIDLALAPRYSLDQYIQLSRRVTLAEMMVPLLPEIYSVLYSQPDRDPELASVTVAEIMAHLQLAQRIS